MQMPPSFIRSWLVSRIREEFFVGSPFQSLEKWLDKQPIRKVALMARLLIWSRPLTPYPGWFFGAGEATPSDEIRIRRAFWYYFHDRRLEHPIMGRWFDVRFRAFIGNDLTRALFVEGCVDPNEFAFLDHFLRRGMVFVDVGANEGLYSLFARARVGRRGRVLAIEPSYRECRRFKRNLVINGFLNVSLKQVALHASKGTARLLVADYGHEGHNTLGEFVYEIEPSHEETVELRTLDDVVDEEGLSHIDFIKIDAEGAEAAILAGAERTLRRWQPAMLVEIADESLRSQGSSAIELLNLLESYGYELHIFHPQTAELVPIDKAALPSGNVVVMAPKARSQLH